MSTLPARHVTFLSPDPEAFADRQPRDNFTPARVSLQYPSGDIGDSFQETDAAKGSALVHHDHPRYPFHVVLLAATAACVLWTLWGALLVVVGHAVLQSCPFSESYLSLAHAARAGALGGIIISVPIVAIAFVLQHWVDAKNRICHAILHYVLVVAAGAADGVVGAAILKFSVVKGPALDLPHATAAGAVGGTILGAPLAAWKILYSGKSS